MLMPKKVKHRKQHRGRLTGMAKGGATIDFGDFGIQALEPGWVTARQIEAARIAMTRHVRRGGKVWIRVFPDKPVTQKPAETRMGSGKGNPEHWVAVVRPGRILFELSGVDEALAARRCRAIQKLPMKARFVVATRRRCSGGAGLMTKASELRLLDEGDLQTRLVEARKELFNLRFQLATGRLDNFGRIRHGKARDRSHLDVATRARSRPPCRRRLGGRPPTSEEE